MMSLRYVKRRAMRFANFEAIESFTGEKILSKNYVTLAMRVLTLLFLVLAISGTVIHYVGRSSSSDFVLAIDVSGSMLADDYKPNRLSAAKESALVFIDSLPEDSRVGLVSFAGIAFAKHRVTDDLDSLREAVKGISAETVGGTAIGDAIISSVNLLANSDRAKTVVLLTDGQSNVGMDVQEAVAYAAESGVMVNTIGIGTESGGSFQNTTFVSKPDTESLRYIANQTGGHFYMAKNESDLSGLYASIAASEERLLSTNISPTLLLLALLFFFVEWFLTNTKFRTLP